MTPFVAKTQFNIIHSEAGLKVDVMIPVDDAFNRNRLTRSVRLEPIPDHMIPFASIEDVILKKMEYYLEGGSVKHIRDINGVLKMSDNKIDRAYINDWAIRLGVKDIWDRILADRGEKT